MNSADQPHTLSPAHHAARFTRQEVPRMRTKRPRTNTRLLRKIRMGLWSQPELQWLLDHLGESLTPDVDTEIRCKLAALPTRKGVD